MIGNETGSEKRLGILDIHPDASDDVLELAIQLGLTLKTPEARPVQEWQRAEYPQAILDLQTTLRESDEHKPNGVSAKENLEVIEKFTAAVKKVLAATPDSLKTDLEITFLSRAMERNPFFSKELKEPWHKEYKGLGRHSLPKKFDKEYLLSFEEKYEGDIPFEYLLLQVYSVLKNATQAYLDRNIPLAKLLEVCVDAEIKLDQLKTYFEYEQQPRVRFTIPSRLPTNEDQFVAECQTTQPERSVMIEVIIPLNPTGIPSHSSNQDRPDKVVMVYKVDADATGKALRAIDPEEIVEGLLLDKPANITLETLMSLLRGMTESGRTLYVRAYSEGHPQNAGEQQIFIEPRKEVIVAEPAKVGKKAQEEPLFPVSTQPVSGLKPDGVVFGSDEGGLKDLDKITTTDKGQSVEILSHRGVTIELPSSLTSSKRKFPIKLSGLEPGRTVKVNYFFHTPTAPITEQDLKFRVVRQPDGSTRPATPEDIVQQQFNTSGPTVTRNVDESGKVKTDAEWRLALPDVKKSREFLQSPQTLTIEVRYSDTQPGEPKGDFDFESKEKMPVIARGYVLIKDTETPKPTTPAAEKPAAKVEAKPESARKLLDGLSVPQHLTLDVAEFVVEVMKGAPLEPFFGGEIHIQAVLESANSEKQFSVNTPLFSIEETSLYPYPHELMIPWRENAIDEIENIKANKENFRLAVHVQVLDNEKNRTEETTRYIEFR